MMSMSLSTPLPYGVSSTGPAEHHPGIPTRWFWLTVSLATIVGTFVLPMAFPTSTFLRSASYMAGFNNTVASLAVVGISVLVTSWLVWKRLGARISSVSADQAMPVRWLGISFAYAAVFTSVLGFFMSRSDVNHSDLFYWQMQIQRWSHDHARLYRDFEFAYGPILFYWPAYLEKGLGHLGIDPIIGFMLAQGTLQLLGLVILFYLLQQLPFSRTLKGIALAAITFGTLTPLLGINYTMVRFGTALAALLWISKHKSLSSQLAAAFSPSSSRSASLPRSASPSPAARSPTRSIAASSPIAAGSG